MTQEEKEDFRQIRNTLGFRAFLDTLRALEKSYREAAFSEPDGIASLVKREQSIGASKALTDVIDNHYVHMNNQ